MGCVTTVNNVYGANGQNESITNAKIAPCMEPNVTPTPLLPPTSIILVPLDQDFVEFSLDCTRYSSFLVWLSNNIWLSGCRSGMPSATGNGAVGVTGIRCCSSKA
jgi:hypothetical protein